MVELTKRLKIRKTIGAKSECHVLEVEENGSLYLFNELVERLKGGLNAKVEKTAGGAVHNDWLIVLNIGGKEIHARWNWELISFSTTELSSEETLLKVEDFIKAIKFNRLKLWLGAKLG